MSKRPKIEVTCELKIKANLSWKSRFRLFYYGKFTVVASQDITLFSDGSKEITAAKSSIMIEKKNGTIKHLIDSNQY